MLPANYQNKFFEFPRPAALKWWAREFESMARHTQKRDAQGLIKKTRPNEPEDVHKYRVGIFEHITNQAIIRAINNLQRIFSQTKATIKTDDETREYLTAKNFDGLTFKTFVNQRLLNRMIDDPNGLLVWWPDQVGDITKKVEPVPLLVLSSDIQHMTREYVSFLSPEKSMVEVGKQGQVMDGNVYYIIDKDEGYFKLIQVGKKEKNKYSLEPYYQQKFNDLPVITLGGESTSELSNPDNKGQKKEIHFLTSYFSGFVPFANEVIRGFSDYQAAKLTSAYPIREMDGIECDECNGKGYIEDREEVTNKLLSKSTCGSCQGTRLRIPSSPYGVILRKPAGQNVLEGEVQMKEAMRYITPPVDILKFMSEDWKENLLLAEKALSLNYIDEAQSGVAKEIDRESLTAMIDRIGTNLYLNIYRNTILILQTLRTRGKIQEVEIIMPNTFRLRSEADLVDELTKLIEKDASIALILEVNRELTRKRYAGDETVIKAVDILSLYDPFFVYPLEKRMDLYAAGAILWEEYRKSLFSYSAIMEIARQDKQKFLEDTYDSIAAQLDTILAPKISRPGAPPEA